jgi:hypothetical protein
VARYPHGRIERLADGDLQLRRLIRELACQAISGLEARILILGPTTAREKVGYFLVEIERRLSYETAETVVLPMSRYDIADYLTLSVETVMVHPRVPIPRTVRRLPACLKCSPSPPALIFTMRHHRPAAGTRLLANPLTPCIGNGDLSWLTISLSVAPRTGRV